MSGEGNPGGRPSGTLTSKPEFVEGSRLAPFGISRNINELLTRLQETSGSLEDRNRLANEVGEIVNKMLDSVESERGLKKPATEATSEVTSGLKSINKIPVDKLGNPAEKLTLGGKNSRPGQGKSVEEMFKERVAPFINDTHKRDANLNSRTGELARDLRKSLGLAEDEPISLDNRTFNELVTAKRELYKPNYSHRTKQEFIPRNNPLRPIVTPGAFLNIDCEKHVSERIDEWLSLIRMTTATSDATPDIVYEFCVAALTGTAQKF